MTSLSSASRELPQRTAKAAGPPFVHPTAMLMRMAPLAGPLVQRTLEVRNTVGIAERIHESLVQKAALHRRCDCPELTGHDRDGRPLDRGHRHAHILPVDLDRDGSLDHVLIWVPMGMGPRCKHAIEQLNTLVAPGGDSVIGMYRLNRDDFPALSRFPHVMLEPGQTGPPDHAMMLADALCNVPSLHSESDADDQHRAPRHNEETTAEAHLRSAHASHSSQNARKLSDDSSITSSSCRSTANFHSPEDPRSDRHADANGHSAARSNDASTWTHLPKGSCRRREARIVEPSSTWISLTPFVPARFVKPRGKNSVEGQVQSELRSRDLPPAEQIELIDSLSDTMRTFQLARRRGKPQPPRRIGFAVRLRFAQPVFGPIALGYGSHFGLGVFQVDQDN